MHSMVEVLDASSSDEVKLWLQQVHAALEKQPARELFAKFNRDTTVCIVQGMHAMLAIHCVLLSINLCCNHEF